MFEIKDLIGHIGLWNLFSILTFIIGTIYTSYTYFKSFYRIVYEHEQISFRCGSIKVKPNVNQIYTSRLIFYNNGRKTLTKNELKKIQIYSSQISSFKFITKTDIHKNRISNDKKIINIEIDYLDASNYFVVEFNHKESINVKGRVIETGDFLHTETKGWQLINIFFIILFFVSIIYIGSTTNNDILYGKLMINLIMFVLFFFLLRYVHKLFFIPDSVTSKFLKTTDKWNNDFYNKF